VISGNARDGIVAAGGSEALIIGNRIGMDVGGTQDLGNGQAGVKLGISEGFAKIGGPNPGEGNQIANNGKAGVVVFGAVALDNSIRGNRIFRNGGLGID